jgi:hypothetical protein
MATIQLNIVEQYWVEQFRDNNISEALTRIIKCSHQLGKSMTREQANKFEAITMLIPHPPPALDRQRAHYTKAEIWNEVWKVLVENPIMRSDTIDGILAKFEAVQALLNP